MRETRKKRVYHGSRNVYQGMAGSGKSMDPTLIIFVKTIMKSLCSFVSHMQSLTHKFSSIAAFSISISLIALCISTWERVCNATV